LVLNPPRDRPIAWSSPAFLGAGAVLMGAHNGAVDHRIFIVGISGKMQEDLLPDTRFGPSAEALMHVLPIAEALRQITPRHTSAITIQHGLDEQPVVRRRYPHMTLLARQQLPDTLPLIVAHAIASHRSAPNRLTPYESKISPRRNPLNEDTP
jgi:hypothetical protein